MNVEIAICDDKGGEYYIRKYEVVHNAARGDFIIPSDHAALYCYALKVYVDGDPLEVRPLDTGAVATVPGQNMHVHFVFKPSFGAWLQLKKHEYNQARYGRRG